MVGILDRVFLQIDSLASVISSSEKFLKCVVS